MRWPEFYSAVYLVIKNEKWEVLVWRRVSDFKNGYFQIIPAWHLEWYESIMDCAVREAKEELWIEVKKEDLKVIHTCHRVKKDERVYFDIYLEVKKYQWVIKRCEDDKCSEIRFVDINALPEDKFVMYDIETLRKAYSWECFSDIVTY